MKRLFLAPMLALLLPAAPAAAQQATVNGRVFRDGTEITCDLPGSEHLKNKAGRDGQGLCVFTSLDMAARWQNAEALVGFRDWMTTQKGGGWPERVKQLIPQMAAAKGLPAPDYVQYQGKDPALLDLAIKTGRMPCVTYGYSERYRQRIAHMVNLVHLDAKWAVVLDNNFPGEDRLEWVPRAEFLRRWTLTGGGGWAVVLLTPPPPPLPTTGTKKEDRAMTGPLFLGAALVLGQCPGGVCPPPPAPPMHEWRTHATDPDRVYLYRAGRQVGGYDYAGAYYRPYDAATGAWGTRQPPPLTPPARQQRVLNFGLDEARLSKKGAYELSGVAVDARRALAAVGDGQLSDDSNRWHLTCIGSAAARQRVARDLAESPKLAPYRGKLLTHAYAPDHWAVGPFNVAALGKPADPVLILQGPPDAKGRAPVVHAQFDYQDGPDGLAEAVRKADPTFRLDAQPDLRKPTPAPTLPTPSAPADTPHLPGWACALLGVVALLTGQRMVPLLLDRLKGLRVPQVDPTTLQEILDLLQKVLQKLEKPNP